jgi:hypothetical protein
MATVSEPESKKYTYSKVVLNLADFERHITSHKQLPELRYSIYTQAKKIVHLFFNTNLTMEQWTLLSRVVQNYHNVYSPRSAEFRIKYFSGCAQLDYSDEDAYSVNPDSTKVVDLVLTGRRYIVYGNLLTDTDAELVTTQGTSKISSRGFFFSLVDVESSVLETERVSLKIPENLESNFYRFNIISPLIDGEYDNSKFLHASCSDFESEPSWVSLVFDEVHFTDDIYTVGGSGSGRGNLILADPGKYVIMFSATTTTTATTNDFAVFRILLNEVETETSNTGIFTTLNVSKADSIIKIQAKGGSNVHKCSILLAKFQSDLLEDPGYSPQSSVNIFTKYTNKPQLLNSTLLSKAFPAPTPSPRPSPAQAVSPAPELSTITFNDEIYTELDDASIRVNKPGVYIIHYQINATQVVPLLRLLINDTPILTSSTNILDYTGQLLINDVIKIDVVSSGPVKVDGASMTILLLEKQTGNFVSNFNFHKEFRVPVTFSSGEYVKTASLKTRVLPADTFLIECNADFIADKPGRIIEARVCIDQVVHYHETWPSDYPLKIIFSKRILFDKEAAHEIVVSAICTDANCTAKRCSVAITQNK